MKLIGVLVVSAFLVFTLGLVFAYPLMLLMNWLFTPALLVYVFGGPITFWKAYGFSLFMAWVVKSTCTHTKSD